MLPRIDLALGQLNLGILIIKPRSTNLEIENLTWLADGLRWGHSHGRGRKTLQLLLEEREKWAALTVFDPLKWPPLLRHQAGKQTCHFPSTQALLVRGSLAHVNMVDAQSLSEM